MRTRISAAAAAATAAAAAGAFAVVGALAPMSASACGVGTSFLPSVSSAPPESKITVTGNGFASAPVTLRWGSLSGPVLATVNGPIFSNLPIVIPNVAPGLYYIDAWDGVGQKYVTATITVTPAQSGQTTNQSSQPPPSGTSTGTTAPPPAGTSTGGQTMPAGSGGTGTTSIAHHQGTTAVTAQRPGAPVSAAAPGVQQANPASAAQGGPSVSGSALPAGSSSTGVTPGSGLSGDLAAGFQPGSVLPSAGAGRATAPARAVDIGLLLLAVAGPLLVGASVLARRRRAMAR